MKKIISLILSIAMIFSFAAAVGASGNYSDDVLKTVYNATMLIGNDVAYNAAEKITYGQLAGAAVNIYMNEKETSYAGLETEYAFEHKYARAFYAVARDVLNKQITLQIDNPNMTVGDVQKEIDPGIGTKPIIQNSRTLLPVRAVVEEMNGNVGWNNDTREVTLSRGGSTIVLTIDSTTAYLNGAAQELDCAPIILNGRTLLPIRFIAESFGYTVGWEPNERIVTIAKSAPVALTAEEADKNATVGDTIDVLTYYLAKRNNNNVTFNKGELLEGEDRNAEINHKQFSELLCELDDIAPLLIKIELTKGSVQTNVPVKIQKDLSKYPENSADYRVIFEEVPLKMYKESYEISDSQKPIEKYDFARDFRDIFIGILTPWIDAAASQAGVEMKFTYYPSLCVENGNGYTMRVRVDVISVEGTKMLGDIFNTADGSNPPIEIKAGSSFFCDFRNNKPIDNVVMPSDTMTIAGLYYIN